MSPQLQVEALELSYDGHAAVRGLSFSLAHGAIGCLLGPSGCGKTSVLRCIAGFESPTAGRILLDGELVSSPEVGLAPEKRRVGMVFQEHALFPHLTAAGNIAFGFPNRKEKPGPRAGTRRAHRHLRTAAQVPP